MNILSRRSWPVFSSEQWLLLLIAAFLPCFEVVKNIAIVAYLLCWLFNRVRDGDWGGAYDHWDVIMFALIGSAYASAAFGAFVPDKGLAAANHVLACGLVFLAVRRSRFSADFLWVLLAVILTSTLMTLAYGYWKLWVTQEYSVIQLRSVGHVNHSAIYMAIVLGMAVSWSVTCWSTASTWKRFLLVLSTGILWLSLLVSAARGAIIPAVLILFLLPATIVWMQTHRMPWKPMALILGLLVLTLTWLPGAIKKIDINDISSRRLDLAKTAVIAAREFPVFGVGISAFYKINSTLTAQWQEKRGRWFADDELFYTSHAHGLYTNTLAERGLTGIASLAALLITVVAALSRRRTQMKTPLALTLWGAVLSAWGVTMIGGLFNTTLHHEHAHLVLILTGIWLAWVRQSNVADS